MKVRLRLQLHSSEQNDGDGWREVSADAQVDSSKSQSLGAFAWKINAGPREQLRSSRPKLSVFLSNVQCDAASLGQRVWYR